MQNAFIPHDHAHCATSAMERVERVCSERGLRLTPIRKKTLEILLERHQALGAYDVLQKLSEHSLADKPPMAYRALNFLVENGFAHRVERLNAYVACAHPDAAHTPALWICSNCHKVAETAQSGELGQALGQDRSFSINKLTIEAEGSCQQCRKGNGYE